MTTEALVHSDTTSRLVGAPPEAAASFPGLVDGVRNLFATTTVAETLYAVVDLAHRGFAADGAGLLWTTRGGAASAAASGPEARRADLLQVDCHQGPGFHAMNGRQPVISPQLRFDGRWRFWSPQAADLGLSSVLALALVDGAPFAAVTVYSKRPSFFRTDSLAPGLWFAEQASRAITAAQQRERVCS
ncbi:MAG: GAF domain-containing protein [Propionibacteriaceae bacterium]